MQTLTENAVLALKRGSRVGVSIAVSAISGNFTLTHQDIFSGSLTLDRNSVSGQNLEIGNAETTELTFTIDNRDGRFDGVIFEGATLTVDFIIGIDTLRAGVFIVDQRPKRNEALRIVALDKMAKTNIPYGGSLTYPATLYTILDDICDQCGLTLATVSFPNSTYSVAVRPTDEMTCHEMVCHVAELAGRVAWIDSAGELNLSWYADQGAEILKSDRYVGFEISESDVTITGVYDKDHDYLSGTDTYALVIENNPLLQDNYQAVVNTIVSNIGGFTYRPFTARTFGFPHIWQLDVINPLVDTNGTNYVSIVTNHKYVLNGMSVFKAVGETETVKGYASASPFTPKQRKIIQQAAESEASSRVDPVINALLATNAKVANSLGMYQTTTADPAGGNIIYWHDASTLAGSTYIEKQSAAGHWYTNSGWAGEEATIWEYGYSNAGDAIFRYLSAYKVMAEWIQGDYIQSNDGSVRINLADGIVETVGATGSVEQQGNTINVKYRDATTGKHIATITITSDAQAGDSQAHLQIAMTSPQGGVESYIEQTFNYDSNGIPSSISPLIIRSAHGVKIDSKMEILDLIQFGGMIIQKKTESGNEGIDFIFNA
jgi:hypothetical protein